jgi:hypothetical protein
MMDTNEDCPLEGPRSITAPLSYFLLKCKLTDEAVREKRSLRVVLFAHDGESLISNNLREFDRLTSELRTDFARVVDPCKEGEDGPCLRLVPIPHGSHESTVMLTQVVIEQEPGNVSGIHQVLHNR